MYKKRSQYFFKQTDFMIVDLLCLFLAYTASSVFISNALEMEVSPSFRRDALIVLLLDLVVAYMWDAFLDVLIRDAFAELESCIKHALRLFMAMVLFFFLNGESDFYVRGILIECILIYVTLTFGGRLLWKAYQKNIRNKTGTLSIHLVTTKKLAEECIRNVQLDPTERYRVAGITIVDQDCRGSDISGIPVVSTQEDLIDYICQNWIDEVFLCMPTRTTLPEDIMRTMRQMGLVLHMNVSEDSDLLGKKQSTGKIGGYVVLTTALRYATSGQMLLKRLLDIVGGIVGCIITGILFLILAPMIKINSPGPVFFKQERVGRNGKHFYIYKFRSMVMNADKIKAELMDQNRVENGYMFKMENDPRIIGSRIVNGKYKKGIGNFIRDYSLDEFPQFLNVLLGSMSIVGTRPPTLDEVANYQPHHHARLAVKPGITGIWQISGRSNITDFEEVVKMDLQYINEWSFLLDLKIIMKTIAVVFKREGSM